MRLSIKCKTKFQTKHYRQWLLTLVLLPQFICACSIAPASDDDALIDWKRQITSGREALARQDYDKAFKEFNDSLQTVKKEDGLSLFEAISRKELGQLYIKRGEDAKASDELKQAVATFEKQHESNSEEYRLYRAQHCETLFSLGKLEKRAGNFDAAKKDFRAAIHADDKNAVIDECEAELVSLDGTQNKNKIEEIDSNMLRRVMKVVKAEKEPMKAIFERSQKMCDESDVDDAGKFLVAARSYFEKQENKLAIWLTNLELIQIYYRLGKTEKAESLCENTIKVSANDADHPEIRASALAALSIIQSRLKLSTESEKSFVQATQLAQKDSTRIKIAELIDALANIDESDGRLDLAKSDLDHALSIMQEVKVEDESLVKLQIDMAKVLILQNKAEEALTFLPKSDDFSKDPKLKFTQNYALAEAYLQLGKTQQAKKYAKAASEHCYDAESRLNAYSILGKLAEGKKSESSTADK
ncbi:MAG: hypothetical protein K2X81_07760 [Candidatus Obscuribacterales bacterium]|nr:hypothetical protein [Candidatus Obscuribacterales bacterium]